VGESRLRITNHYKAGSDLPKYGSPVERRREKANKGMFRWFVVAGPSDVDAINVVYNRIKQIRSWLRSVIRR
jgi:hypothetical protein